MSVMSDRQGKVGPMQATHAVPLRFPSPEIARRWAQRMLDAGDALVVDTETTSLFGDVVQVAVMDLRGHAVVNQLTCPRAAIDPEAQRVHGIGPLSVAAAPSFAQVAPALATLLGGRRLLAYNADYDRSVLNQEFTLAGHRPSPAPQWECLLEARRSFNAGRRLPLRGPHDALGDCAAALSLLYAMAGSRPPKHLPPADLHGEPPLERAS